MIYSPAFLVASPADLYQSGTQRVDFQTNQGVVFAPKGKPTRFLGGLRQIQFSYELFCRSRPYRSRTCDTLIKSQSVIFYTIHLFVQYGCLVAISKAKYSEKLNVAKY